MAVKVEREVSVQSFVWEPSVSSWLYCTCALQCLCLRVVALWSSLILLMTIDDAERSTVIYHVVSAWAWLLVTRWIYSVISDIFHCETLLLFITHIWYKWIVSISPSNRQIISFSQRSCLTAVQTYREKSLHSISTSESDPRLVCGARRLSGARLVS